MRGGSLSADDTFFNHGYDFTAKLTSTCAADPSWLASIGASEPASYSLVANGAEEAMDQYATINGGVLTYDGRGNMLSDASNLTPGAEGHIMTYAHDSENRLTHATNALWTADYAYDPVGRRTGTISSQYADLSYVHAGDMEIAEYDATSGDLLRRYIPGAGVDQRAAMLSYTGGAEITRHYYHTNRLGSVVALVDSGGAITDKYLYTAYGVEDVQALSGNPFRYTGRKLDADSGLRHCHGLLCL